MRYAVALLGLSCALCLTGCREERVHGEPAAGTAPVAVPDLYDENLDEAEERLDELKIGYAVDSGDERSSSSTSGRSATSRRSPAGVRGWSSSPSHTAAMGDR